MPTMKTGGWEYDTPGKPLLEVYSGRASIRAHYVASAVRQIGHDIYHQASKK